MTVRTILPGIFQYKEALLGSLSRFKTLERVEPRMTHDDEPNYVSSQRAVLFKVNISNEEAVLKCFLCREHLENAKIICDLTKNIDSSFLINSLFLEKEMLVFDAGGGCDYYDVVVTPNPQGISIKKFIDECIYLNKETLLEKTACEFSRLAMWMINSGFFVSGLRWENIIIRNDGTLALCFIDTLKPIDATAGEREPLHDFYKTLSIILALLQSLPHNKDLYSALELNNSIRFFEKSAENYASFVQLISPAPDSLLKKLADSAINADYSAFYFLLNEFCPQADPSPVDENSSLEKESHLVIRSAIRRQGEKREEKPEVSTESYTFFDDFHENLAAVSRASDGKCGFIDRSRNVVIPFIYDWAGDFKEGLAIVKRNGLYGLVNRFKEEVVPVKYEDIDWYAETNVAIVMLEGTFGIVDRTGRALTPPKYAWISPFNEKYTRVQDTNLKWGCLQSNGNEVIHCIYDSIEIEDGFVVGMIDGNKRTLLDIRDDR